MTTFFTDMIPKGNDQVLAQISHIEYVIVNNIINGDKYDLSEQEMNVLTTIAVFL